MSKSFDVDILTHQKVQKRDGRIVPFDRKRIERAIYKAFQAVGETSETIPNELSQVVTNQLFEKFGTNTTVDIDTRRDLVQETLIQ